MGSRYRIEDYKPTEESGWESYPKKNSWQVDFEATFYRMATDERDARRQAEEYLKHLVLVHPKITRLTAT